MGSSIPRDDNDIPAAGGQLPSGLLQAMQLDATGNLKTSSTAGGTSNVDVIDRIARLLGHVIIDSFGSTVDVSDRAARLLGVEFNSAAILAKLTPLTYDGSNNLKIASYFATTNVLNLASASQALPYTGADLPVSSLKELAIGINLTALTGGTSPTVTFFITSKGLDGIYYIIYTGGANPGAASLPLSLGMGANSPGGVAFGSVIRLNAVGGGTIAPTAATFSASIIGK